MNNESSLAGIKSTGMFYESSQYYCTQIDKKPWLFFSVGSIKLQYMEPGALLKRTETLKRPCVAVLIKERTTFLGFFLKGQRT
jgi:hypothetical protein